MKNKYYSKQQQEIVERVMEKLRPVIRREINELSSTTYDDAADLWAEFRNAKKEKMFRNAAAAMRAKERATPYDKTVNVIEDTKIGTKRFIIAKYIPANINVLIYFSDRNYVAVVRVTDKRLINIEDRDIKDDIVLTYNGYTLVKDNVHTIGAALGQNIHNARTLANIINTDLGTHISYKYFMAEPMTRVASKSTVGNYMYLNDDIIGGKHFAVAKFIPEDKNKKEYAIFYILIGDAKKTSVMSVYKLGIGNRVSGFKKPGPLWTMLKNTDKAGKSNNNGWTKETARPTRSSCDIVNVYDMLKSMPKWTLRMFFSNIRTITDLSISMDDVEYAYMVATGLVNADEEELKVINSGGDVIEDAGDGDEEPDNGSDFMV